MASTKTDPGGETCGSVPIYHATGGWVERGGHQRFMKYQILRGSARMDSGGGIWMDERNERFGGGGEVGFRPRRKGLLTYPGALLEGCW